MLYTLRDLLAADPAGTLAEVRRIGYRNVELAGYAGLTAAAFKELLDAHDLRAVGSHVGHARWRDDLDAQLADAVTLEVPWVGTADVAADIPRTTAGFTALAAEFDAFGRAARRRGLRGFYFHNHDGEFARDPADGAILLETLMANTDPRFVAFQLDIYWADQGLRALGLPGGGPAVAEFLRRHRDRVRLFHVKDRNPLQGEPGADDWADPGEGDIDFPAVFAALGRLGRRPGQVRYLVERDSQPYLGTDHPYRTAETGYAYLRSLSTRDH
jgi:sugar phosphate isomerase/epimerase